jgi:hypothetical protein
VAIVYRKHSLIPRAGPRKYDGRPSLSIKNSPKSVIGEANLLSYQQFATAKRAGN